MSANAWYAFYPSDYARDTQHLTWAEHGMYRHLLDACYAYGGALPADDERLRMILHMMPADEFSVHRPVLLAFFYRDGDTYRHRRIDQELARAQKAQDQRKAASKAGVAARQRKSVDQPDDRTVDRPVDRAVDRPVNQPQPQPHKEESVSPTLSLVPPARAVAVGGVEGIEIERSTGKRTLCGWYVDDVQNDVIEDARIDTARWRGDFRPLHKWLRDGITPQEIRRAIQGFVAWKGADYVVPGSLAMFSTVVERERGKRPAA